jgi:hypothetical protein
VDCNCPVIINGQGTAFKKTILYNFSTKNKRLTNLSISSLAARVAQKSNWNRAGGVAEVLECLPQSL